METRRANIVDSFVAVKNKSGAGTGAGEGKLYVGAREEAIKFFAKPGVSLIGQIYASNLMECLRRLEPIYMSRHKRYRATPRELAALYRDRCKRVSRLKPADGPIEFLFEVTKAGGRRGYLNSNSAEWKLMREIGFAETCEVMIVREASSPEAAEQGAEAGRVPRYSFVMAVRASSLDDTGRADAASESGIDDTRLPRFGRDVVRSRKERVGQAEFRKALMDAHGRCFVLGVSEPAALRASHIRPWSVCCARDRLDPSNGLLLSAHLDALFDEGFITFSSETLELRVSSRLSASDAQALGIARRMKLNLPTSAMNRLPRLRDFLSWHEGAVFVT